VFTVFAVTREVDNVPLAFMDVLAQSLPPFLAKPQRPIAVSGVVLAIMGLIVAIAAPAFLEAKEAPPTDLPHVLAESATKIKERLAHKKIEVQPAPRISWKGALMLGGACAGFLGAALGTASWARRENSRWSSLAIAAGLTAIAWNYFVMAALGAVSLFLMAWIISHFHR
jgi:hypothetical protein